MKVPVFLFGLVTALMMACGQKKETEKEIPERPILVFKADSLLFDALEVDSSLVDLTPADVRNWSGDYFLKDTSGDVKWVLSDFFRIDSLKANGKYPTYVAHLDLGMTKDVAAKQIKDIRLDDKSKLKLWLLKHSSYEACPFTSGTEVLATLIYEGKVKNCYLLAQETHSSDPPVWFSREKYGEVFTDGLIKIKTKESSCEGETDKNDEDIVRTKFMETSFVIRGGQTADIVSKTWNE